MFVERSSRVTALKTTSGFEFEVTVEQREGYFAARTKPFAITVYGNTAEEAENRAVQAVELKLQGRSDV